MSKRVLVCSLWLLVGWVVGATLTSFDLVPVPIAPATALIFGLAVAWDPKGWVWRR